MKHNIRHHLYNSMWQGHQASSHTRPLHEGYPCENRHKLAGVHLAKEEGKVDGWKVSGGLGGASVNLVPTSHIAFANSKGRHDSSKGEGRKCTPPPPKWSPALVNFISTVIYKLSYESKYLHTQAYPTVVNLIPRFPRTGTQTLNMQAIRVPGELYGIPKRTKLSTIFMV